MKTTLHKFFIAILCTLLSVVAFGQTTVVVTKEDYGKKINLAEDQILNIKLNSQYSGSGYCWTIKETNQNVIKQFGEWTITHNEDSKLMNGDIMVGVQEGIQNTKLSGTSKGETNLILEYKRPWEKTEPIETFQITINSHGKYIGKEKPIEVLDSPLPKDPTTVSSIQGLPSKYNLMDMGVLTSVRDQQINKCGSCWAHATCAVFETLIKAKDSVDRDLSEQWFVDCYVPPYPYSDPSCKGGWCSLDAFVSKGCVYESDMPYIAADGTCGPSYTFHEKATAYKKMFTNATIGSVDSIKKYVYTYGALNVSVRYNNPQFLNYTGGVFSYNDTQQIDHAITLVGWNDSLGGYWYLKNSFGTAWGENGFMRIKWGVSSIGYDPRYLIYKGKPLGPLTPKVLNPTSANNLKELEKNISIFPNPNNGEFTVTVQNPSGSQLTISIMNTLGQAVSTDVTNSNFVKTINIKELPKGIYSLKVTNEGNASIKKIIIE